MTLAIVVVSIWDMLVIGYVIRVVRRNRQWDKALGKSIREWNAGIPHSDTTHVKLPEIRVKDGEI